MQCRHSISGPAFHFWHGPKAGPPWPTGLVPPLQCFPREGAFPQLLDLLTGTGRGTAGTAINTVCIKSVDIKYLTVNDIGAFSCHPLMPSRVKGTKDHGISTPNLKARVTRMQNKLAESFNDLFGFWMVYIFLIFVFTNSFFLEHARPLSFQGIASRSTVGLVFCCGHHCGRQTRYDGRDATNSDDDFEELGYLE